MSSKKILPPEYTNQEIKEMCVMMQHNHEIMKNCFMTYCEVHDKYMNKLLEHLEKIGNE